MKILIAGAGPAGLSFAALMAEADRSHAITVLERSSEDVTPGWGLTLRDHALSFLDLQTQLTPQFLDGRAFRFRGELTVDLPNPPDVCLATFSRTALTRALTERCRDSGVRLRYQVDAASVGDAEIASYDLVVAADGAHSAIRQRYADLLKPTMTLGRNRFAWLGAATAFDKLTLLLSDQDLVLLAWAYKYTPELSTFIVECSDQTWERGCFAEKSADEACATIGRAFEHELGGGRILAGGSIQWSRFHAVSCERLQVGNVVLIGDAAHTTHFSQGFGTMFAFDDALALRSALDNTPDISQALSVYETLQQPKIVGFQATASASMEWSQRLLDNAESGDEAAVRELIAARWPNNAVVASPLGPGAV